MKPTRLDRAVARATGEPVRRICQMGFSLIVVPERPDRRSRRGQPRKDR